VAFKFIRDFEIYLDVGSFELNLVYFWSDDGLLVSHCNFSLSLVEVSSF
jgi:hypothetical protein